MSNHPWYQFSLFHIQSITEYTYCIMSNVVQSFGHAKTSMSQPLWPVLTHCLCLVPAGTFRIIQLQIHTPSDIIPWHQNKLSLDIPWPSSSVLRKKHPVLPSSAIHKHVWPPILTVLIYLNLVWVAFPLLNSLPLSHRQAALWYHS